ncbi:rhamnosyltransferase WsaF family glycosyltransferase [Agromyces sp. SYSU T00266]|uniref:rhamnosyltransferase WsaF family glycosyltransferase n=1 Tax=Agromyces zhanjiangensis TaxID=3158562 RepID=UPI003393F905
MLRTSKLHLVPHRPVMLVANDDALDVDWTVEPDWRRNPIEIDEPERLHIAWIMSPPGRESGGHQNLFRFIKFAENAGHTCSVYFYNATGIPVSIPDVRAMIADADAYPDVDASFQMWDRETGVDPRAQVLFATGWETAYPAYLDRSRARRLYFVQDFEPSFYPVGSEALLAENTYRFGFRAITAGGWLSTRLHDEYGMWTRHFDFAVDRSKYHVTNTGRRDEIFFYARPVTARRAFEFGLLALEEVARQRPDITINLAGWNVSNWVIPFRHENLSSLDISELNEVYNRCGAALVLSLTNMSLLPLELISSGVAPIVNDAPNNRLVSDNPYIEYVPPVPAVIARRIIEVLEREDAPERSAAMSASLAETDWSHAGAQFLAALQEAVRA